MASNAMAGYTEARPDLRLLFFDGVSKWNEILNDPIRFGFTNITDSALDDTNLVDKSFTGPGALYLNWDCCHATTKAHSLMAQWNFDILTNTNLETLKVTIVNASLNIKMNHLQIGRDYSLQTSADLITWTDLYSFTANAGTDQWQSGLSTAGTAFFHLAWQP